MSINSSRIETRVFNLYSPDGIVGIEQWLPYISYIGKMNSKVEFPRTGEIAKAEYYYFLSDISVEVLKMLEGITGRLKILFIGF